MAVTITVKAIIKTGTKIYYEAPVNGAF
jgi:hypothetical protein